MKNYKDNYLEDVSKMVAKKGKFDFISWAYCEKMGNLEDENFDWRLIPMTNSITGDIGILWGQNGVFFVKVWMTLNKKEREHFYPVLDNNNKPIGNPTNFDINNAQMRGFAKLFSMMTGKGLNLYTGEDLTQYDETPKQETPKINEKITKLRKEFTELHKKHNFSKHDLDQITGGKKSNEMSEEEWFIALEKARFVVGESNA